MTKGKFMMVVLGLIALLGLGCAEKRAILVQVSKYRDARINSFTGTRDAELIDTMHMQRALAQYGFSDFVEISEQQATRRAILDAMATVRRRTRPGDVVVFYFSGHGAASEHGVSLAPHDAALTDASNDITAKDLAEWVRQLPTDHVVIILDCCFYFKSGKKPPAVHPKVIVDRVGAGSPQWGELLNLPKGLVITATSLGSPAFQYHAGRNPATQNYQWAGFFTVALSKELERFASQDEKPTYLDLLARVNTQVGQMIADRGYPFKQTPQILGDESARALPIFGSEGKPVSPTKMPSQVAESCVKPISIYFDASLPKRLREQIIRAFTERLASPNVPVTVVEYRYDANYVFELHQNQILLKDAYGLTESVFMVLAANDVALTEQQAAAASERLTVLAVNHATLRLLLNLYVEHFADREKRIQIRTDKESYRIGDTMQIEIVSPLRGYPILVSQTAHGDLSLLYPIQGDDSLLLSPGIPYKFPQQTGVRFRLTGPPGKDFVCVVVLDSEDDQRMLLRSLGRKQAERISIEKGLEPVYVTEQILQKLVREGRCQIGYIDFLVEE